MGLFKLKMKKENQSHKKNNETSNNKKTKLISNNNEIDGAIKELKKDLKDFIGTFHLKPDDNHIEITSVNTKYMRNFFVVGTGTSSTFIKYLKDLYNHQKTNVSIYIKPMPQSKAKKELKNMIDEYELNLRKALKKGDTEQEFEFRHKLQETRNTLDELHAGENKLFEVSIYISIIEDTLEDLDYSSKELARKLANNEISIESATLKQEELFKSILPVMNNTWAKKYDTAKHLFDRRQLGTTYPFIVGDIGHKKGTIFGSDVNTGKPILINEFHKSLPNPHFTIVGVSGKGKSYGIKQFTARETIRYGLQTVAFDVEGEYYELCEILGGTQVNFDDKTTINLFDINTEVVKDELGNEKEIIDLDTKIAVVQSDILTLITGANAPQDQFYELLSEEIRYLTQKLYDKFEITKDPNSIYESKRFGVRTKKQMPTLSDFYELVDLWRKKVNNPNDNDYDPNMATVYTYLYRMLRKYCKIAGGNFTYFDGPTNVPITDENGDFSPFTNFNLASVPENYLPQVIKILMSFTWETFVKKNSEDPLKAKRRAVLIDEAFRLMPYPSAVDFMDDMARRARKRHVSFRIVTQKVKDFFGDVKKEAILTNSAIIILFGQAEGEINEVQEIFGLNEIEKQLVLEPQKGHCLLIMDSEKIEMQVERHEFEAEFLESDIQELAKIAKNKKRAQQAE